MFATRTSRFVVLLLATVATLLIQAGGASAQVIQFGTLDNFDVFNDTGQVTRGFQIELDGLTSSDVLYTFGAPYQRYGDPQVVSFAGGVYVNYESPYDTATGTFTQGTPLAPSPVTPTLGHACWTGSGLLTDYWTAGCEHFGVSLAGSPTNTVYRWLVEDPAHPGTLQPAGTSVNLPAPTWNVQPAPPGSPNPAPVVAANIVAPEPGAYEFGDALWVKVFVTESADPMELNHMVTDDPAVPQDAAETETEWQMIQQEVGGANALAELTSEAQMGEGNVSVTRRYEFYEYTGAYDSETHEALPAVGDTQPMPDEIGDYLGAQMAAVNVELGPPPDTTAPILHLPAPITADATGPAGAVVTFLATATDDSGVDPAVTCVPASGATFAIGTNTVDCSATDPASNTATGSFDVTIRGAADQVGDAIGVIRGWNLGPTGKRLIRRLTSADRSFTSGSTSRACRTMSSFLRTVQGSKRLSGAQKTELTADGTRIRTVMGC